MSKPITKTLVDVIDEYIENPGIIRWGVDSFLVPRCPFCKFYRNLTMSGKAHHACECCPIREFRHKGKAYTCTDYRAAVNSGTITPKEHLDNLLWFRKLVVDNEIQA